MSRPEGPSWRRADWSPWVRNPGRAALFADFDGTLAPTVEDRDAATPVPGAAQALRRLGERLAVVAVVSGRPVEYLASSLPCGPEVVLAGLYGLQRLVGGRTTYVPGVQEWEGTVARLVAEARAQAPRGLEVEDKGLSLALHSRRAPATAPWAQGWATEAAARSGLVAQSGKFSVELLPPLSTDKGTVVDELAGDLGAVCFLGDDRGDLPAFEALKRLRLAGKTTIGVGVRSDEQPEGLAAAVDVWVDGPEGTLEVLEALAP